MKRKSKKFQMVLALATESSDRFRSLRGDSGTKGARLSCLCSKFSNSSTMAELVSEITGMKVEIIPGLNIKDFPFAVVSVMSNPNSHDYVVNTPIMILPCGTGDSYSHAINILGARGNNLPNEGRYFAALSKEEVLKFVGALEMTDFSSLKDYLHITE